MILEVLHLSCQFSYKLKQKNTLEIEFNKNRPSLFENGEKSVVVYFYNVFQNVFYLISLVRKMLINELVKIFHSKLI